MAKEFETFKEIQLQLKHKIKHKKERELFTDSLSSISDKQIDSNKSKAALMRPWYYVIAGSIIVLFGLFFFDYNNPSFDDYNNPEAASFVEKGDLDPNLKEAQATFNDGKYEAAIPFFETILKVNKTPEIEYFYGVSLLEESKYPKAESVFNELIAGTSAYKEKAKWSLALSKLKQKKYKECKQILQTISQDYENYDDVEQLLDELD